MQSKREQSAEISRVSGIQALFHVRWWIFIKSLKKIWFDSETTDVEDKVCSFHHKRLLKTALFPLKSRMQSLLTVVRHNTTEVHRAKYCMTWPGDGGGGDQRVYLRRTNTENVTSRLPGSWSCMSMHIHAHIFILNHFKQVCNSLWFSRFIRTALQIPRDYGANNVGVSRYVSGRLGFESVKNYPENHDFKINITNVIKTKDTI